MKEKRSPKSSSEGTRFGGKEKLTLARLRGLWDTPTLANKLKVVPGKGLQKNPGSSTAGRVRRSGAVEEVRYITKKH